MRENSRVRSQRFAWSLDARQVTAIVLGALVLLGGAFVLGLSAGHQAAAAHAAPVATGAVLERLDEPPPELEAIQALTDASPIEKAMPVVAVKAAPTPTPTSTGSARYSKGGYTIQVASSTTRGDAERIVRQLSGRQARIVVAEVPGKGRRYRVQLGSYPSQEAAKDQLPQLSRAGIHGIVTGLR